MISAAWTRNRLKNGRPGFTLIEIVFVAVIISILVSLSIPVFIKTFSHLKVKESVYNISKLINFAQERAIVGRKYFKLTFDFAENAYWVSEKDASAGAGAFKRIKGKLGRRFTLPGGIYCDGKKHEVVFYPDGRADKAEVKIFDKKGKGYVLTVKGFGGRVEVKEIEGEK